MNTKLILVLGTFALSANAFSASSVTLSCPDLVDPRTGISSFKITIAEDYAMSLAGKNAVDQAEVRVSGRIGTNFSSENVLWSTDRNPNSGRFIIGAESDSFPRGFMKVERRKSGTTVRYAAQILESNRSYFVTQDQTSDCEVISSTR